MDASWHDVPTTVVVGKIPEDTHLQDTKLGGSGRAISAVVRYQVY